MYKKCMLFISLFVILVFSANAQSKIRGSAKGTIMDTVGKQELIYATVSITPESDSTSPAFAFTDKHGAFSFKGLSPGNYRLLITFEGLQHISRKFSITPSNKDMDFGIIYMRKLVDLLQEVVVQRPPISIKKDTIEYTADLFATKPNAFVEDQLKKLPGVEVNSSGSITAQGETVTRVLVNGKRFFSDDPKLATRNIPPDIVTSTRYLMTSMTKASSRVLTMAIGSKH